MEQKFTISLEIYDIDAVHQAIDDFKDVCKIDFNKQESSLTIFWETSEEIETCFLEFMNYVISL